MDMSRAKVAFGMMKDPRQATLADIEQVFAAQPKYEINSQFRYFGVTALAEQLRNQREMQQPPPPSPPHGNRQNVFPEQEPLRMSPEFDGHRNANE